MKFREYFQLLSREGKWSDDCFRHRCNEEPSPMWTREPERRVHWNWIAILSYTISLALSLAVWRGLFRAVEHLVK